MNEAKKLLELLRKLSESKQKEFYGMVKGAKLYCERRE